MPVQTTPTAGTHRRTMVAPHRRRLHGHGVPHARPHRHAGQPALPRRDDVRRVGQPRPRRLDPDHPPRARRRHQLHRHRRRVLARASPRRSSARRSQAAGATTSCSPPRSTAPMGDDPNQQRQLAPLDHAGGRGQPAPARHRLHRPLPDPPARRRTPTSTRRSARSPTSCAPGKVRYIGSLDVPGRARSSRRSGSPSGAAASASCASSRRTRSSCAASRPTCCPTCQRYGMGVIPWSPLAGGWLSGRYRKGAETPTTHARRRACPHRYDLVAARQPAQARGRRRARRSSPTRPGMPLIAPGDRVRASTTRR